MDLIELQMFALDNKKLRFLGISRDQNVRILEKHAVYILRKRLISPNSRTPNMILSDLRGCAVCHSPKLAFGAQGKALRIHQRKVKVWQFGGE